MVIYNNTSTHIFNWYSHFIVPILPICSLMVKSSVGTAIVVGWGTIQYILKSMMKKSQNHHMKVTMCTQCANMPICPITMGIYTKQQQTKSCWNMVFHQILPLYPLLITIALSDTTTWDPSTKIAGILSLLGSNKYCIFVFSYKKLLGIDEVEHVF